MKISIGTKIKDGPWGGGNLFAINLKNYLISRDHIVVTDLKDPDIDIILITEPRKTSESSSYTHLDVQNYLNYVNPNTLVAHRLNECDERKNTNFVNKYLIEANKISDYSIFVSSWLKDLYENQGINKSNNNVIMAGADKNIFNNLNIMPWKKEEKLRIVTHHWGANWNKGFDIYQYLDNLLYDSFWNEKIVFTYIGNLPKKFKFKNSNYIPPLSGKELANELKKNNLYITGSLNEPSGNHHIEASQCGLPVMYINSGGTNEYCSGYGLEYTKENFELKLKEAMDNYEELFIKMKEYPFNSDKMSKDYLDLFEDMINNKDSILANRITKNTSKLSKFIYLLNKKITQFIN
jgi:hypothetical protein